MPEDAQRKAELTVVLTIFASIALAGAAIILFAVHDFSRARASAGWPQAEAVMLAANGAGAVRYAYVVDGASHVSARYRFHTAIRAPIDAPPPGETATVFVNPEHPGDAVMAPGGTGAIFAVYMGAAGLLIFFGVGGVIRTLMNGARESARYFESAPEPAAG